MPNNVPAPNETNSPANNPPHSNESADSKANASSQTSDQKQSAFLRFLKTLEPYFKQPAFTFFLGLITSIVGFMLANYVAPWLFNIPDVSFTADNYSSVDLPVYNESVIDLDMDTLMQYSAEIPDKATKGSHNTTYAVICGDAKTPGHGDFVLRLNNHGKAQARLIKFGINLLDYRTLDSNDLTISKGAKISKPDDYIVLYGSVDPLIQHSETLRAHQDDTGHLEVSEIPISTTLSPGEHGTYYLQTSFLKYGLYEIEFTVMYTHNNTTYYRTTKDPVYILYSSVDCLSD